MRAKLPGKFFVLIKYSRFNLFTSLLFWFLLVTYQISSNADKVVKIVTRGKHMSVTNDFYPN